MPVLPERNPALLEFARARVDLWAERAEEIGLSTVQAQRIKDLSDAAHEAYQLAQQAVAAARAAVLRQRIAMDALRTGLSEGVKTIRLFGESTGAGAGGEQGVFAAAQIPLPRQRSPAPPPPEPTELSARLEPGDGGVMIIFKAVDRANAGPITYLVRRKLPGERAFHIIGTVGSGRPRKGSNLRSGFRGFVDATLPADLGPHGVQYTIQGERGAARGPESAIFTLIVGGTATERADDMGMGNTTRRLAA